MVTLRKLQTLTWVEWGWLGQALLLLPLINLGLHLFGLQQLRRLLAAFPGHALPAQAEQTAYVQQVARIVNLAARYGPYRATCLRRALLLWWWLQRAGIEAELQIGARFCEGELQAHAWVEVQGQPIWDDVAVRRIYAVFPGAVSSTMSVSR